MLRTKPPGITSPRVRGLTLVTLDMGLSSKTGWCTGVDAQLHPHPRCDNPNVRTALAANRLVRWVGGDRGAVRPARSGRRAWLVGCTVTIIAALAACGAAPVAA